MKNQPRVLIVEDEPAIAELMAVNLRHNGFQPVWTMDAVSAQKELDEVLPDVILLDWMLPGESGLSLAKRWRSHPRTQQVPILMITARGDEPDRVAGLDAGADDYIVKPLCGAPTLLTRGGLTFDTVSRVASMDGRQLRLSTREVAVLEILMRQFGRVVGKDRLMEHLYSADEAPGDNAIEVFVHRLRKKLSGTPVTVTTVYGHGYQLDYKSCEGVRE